MQELGTYTNYAMWNCDGWCVIARELAGGPEVAVVSVQFVPIKPSKGSSPKPPGSSNGDA